MAALITLARPERMTIQAPDSHPTSWRLPHPYIQTLRDVTRGVEETNAGLCTKYIPDALEQFGYHPEGEDQVRLFDVEKFCDLVQALNTEVIDMDRTLERRARNALRLISLKGDLRTVAILHCAYGYPDPTTRAWPKTSIDFLGSDLAQLVRYTDATEERRKRLVRQATLRVPDGRMTAFACRNLDSFTEDGELNRFSSDRLIGLDETIGLSSYIDREVYYDKVISSGDALRDVFEPFPEIPLKRFDGEDRKDYELRSAPYEERRNAYLSKRASFLTEAKVQADLMLSLASARYHEVWKANPV